MLLLVDGGKIGGVGHIYHDGDVRLERVGDLAGAEQPNFLLDVGHRANLCLQFALGVGQKAQCLGHGKGADAIIERACDGEVVAQQVEFVVQSYGITNLHQLLRVLGTADTDVDENFVDFRQLVAVIIFGEVRGDVADDAFDRAVGGVNDDALGLGDGGIDAAHFANVNETFGINVIDGHGDFVGVGGEHEAGGAAFVERGRAIAVGVRIGALGKLRGVVEPHAGRAPRGRWGWEC